MSFREEIQKEYVDAKTAGEILGLSPSRISRLCSGGRFEGAFKVGGSWLIPKQSVLSREPLPPGPKPRNKLSDKTVWQMAVAEAKEWEGRVING